MQSVIEMHFLPAKLYFHSPALKFIALERHGIFYKSPPSFAGWWLRTTQMAREIIVATPSLGIASLIAFRLIIASKEFNKVC